MADIQSWRVGLPAARNDRLFNEISSILLADARPFVSATGRRALLAFVSDKFSYPAHVREQIAPAVLAVAVAHGTRREVPSSLRVGNKMKEVWPLRAAFHLLTLADCYPLDPDEVVAGTDRTLDDLCRNGNGPPLTPDPYTVWTLRARIAATAGKFGRHASAFNTQKSPYFDLVVLKTYEALRALPAESATMREVAVWRTKLEAIKVLAEERDREAKRALATWPSPIEGGQPAPEPNRRRLSRIKAHWRLWGRKWAVRVVMVPAALIAASVAVSALANGVNALIPYGPPLSPVDPLEAERLDESWLPGYGPESDVRDQRTPTGLYLNPVFKNVTPGWPGLIKVIGTDFIEVTGDFGSDNGYRLLEPGTYQVEVTIRAATVSGVEPSVDVLQDVQLRLGLLEADAPGVATHVVFARATADSSSPVWDGDGLLVLCDCTVTLDPSSARLYSDAILDGVAIDPSVTTTGTLVGYSEADGLLPRADRDGSGEVIVRIDLEVSEREWR